MLSPKAVFISENKIWFNSELHSGRDPINEYEMVFGLSPRNNTPI